MSSTAPSTAWPSAIVHGSITCFAGSGLRTIIGDINAGGSIQTGGSIQAGWTIDAVGRIKAVGSIHAVGRINGGESIQAGEDIVARWIFSFRFLVRAKTLKTSLLPFWREYWAEMPPLAKYRNAILDPNNCWEDLKSTIDAVQAVEIYDWPGWHPLLRAQLGMFLGLTTSVAWTPVAPAASSAGADS